MRSDRFGRAWAGSAARAMVACVALLCATGELNAGPEGDKYRGLLGPNNERVKKEDGKTYLWAGPRGVKPSDPKAKWYDFTGSVIPAEQLQFGIGIDAIPSIDDPIFVSPDDARLLNLGRNPYDRSEAPPKTNNDIPVIGFAHGDEARAYPVRILDRHELVNDKIGGKPVTVGW